MGREREICICGPHWEIDGIHNDEDKDVDVRASADATAPPRSLPGLSFDTHPEEEAHGYCVNRGWQVLQTPGNEVV